MLVIRARIIFDFNSSEWNTLVENLADLDYLLSLLPPYCVEFPFQKGFLSEKRPSSSSCFSVWILLPYRVVVGRLFLLSVELFLFVELGEYVLFAPAKLFCSVEFGPVDATNPENMRKYFAKAIFKSSVWPLRVSWGITRSKFGSLMSCNTVTQDPKKKEKTYLVLLDCHHLIRLLLWFLKSYAQQNMNLLEKGKKRTWSYTIFNHRWCSRFWFPFHKPNLPSPT